MPFFLLGAAILLLMIYGGRIFATADPQKLAGGVRKTSGIALLLLAAFLLIRGVLALAVPLAAFALALVGTRRGSMFGFGGGGFNPFGGSSHGPAPGQTSHIATDTLEMELDHDTGELTGRCLKGRFAGRGLSSLSEAEVLALRQELAGGDPQDMTLIEAYLDRRFPEWRGEDDHEEPRRQERRSTARGSRMDRQEAFEVLGLRPGASTEDIRRAHRTLMKKMHPDQGGSTYLAARINEAKEVLVGRR